MSRDRADERWCPSCKMRYRIGPPSSREFSQISMDRMLFSVLLSAAREFDEQAEAETPDELYTAVDFLDWLKHSLVINGRKAA